MRNSPTQKPYTFSSLIWAQLEKTKVQGDDTIVQVYRKLSQKIAKSASELQILQDMAVSIEMELARLFGASLDKDKEALLIRPQFVSDFHYYNFLVTVIIDHQNERKSPDEENPLTQQLSQISEGMLCCGVIHNRLEPFYCSSPVITSCQIYIRVISKDTEAHSSIRIAKETTETIGFNAALGGEMASLNASYETSIPPTEKGLQESCTKRSILISLYNLNIVLERVFLERFLKLTCLSEAFIFIHQFGTHFEFGSYSLGTETVISSTTTGKARNATTKRTVRQHGKEGSPTLESSQSTMISCDNRVPST